MSIERVGVIGAGTMGNGIAHVFARSGYQVTLCDVEQSFLDRALATIGKNLEREVAKNKITAEDKTAALKRIAPALQRAQLADCDFVIEAATEKFEVKTEIFAISIASAALKFFWLRILLPFRLPSWRAVTKRPGKIIGMHFFNPVPVMKLVEVIRGLATRNETFRDGARSGAEARQDSGRSQRRARICFQPRADAVAERSHVRGDGRRRHGGSGGRSVQAGHGASHGPADAWRILSASTSASTSCGCCRMASAIPNTGRVRC